MNNPAPPSEKIIITWLSKLAARPDNTLFGANDSLEPPLPAAEALLPLDKRLRVTYRFWLDAMKDAELELGQEILLLKKRRKFQTTVKDALRLVIDLRAGRVDVLLQLFPWVRDVITQEIMR
jgi:hypothetical protein